MPRKSAAALSVIQPLPSQKKPEPPAELTEEQAVEWRAVVDRLPADWFPRETHQLLVAYCRHVVKARVVARSVDAFDPEWLNDPAGLAQYDKLTLMADREARAISSLATRMRLSQQSSYHPERTKPKANLAEPQRKPWQHVA